MASRSELGLERVKQKLEKCFESGDFYHTHQMYRTIYFRFKRQEKYAECKDIMFEGAERLLSKGELNSGADLAKLYLEVLSKGSIQADSEIMKKLAKLHSMMKPSSPERVDFTGECLQYSTVLGDLSDKKAFGHPNMHRLLALNYWAETNFRDAKYHFTRSLDGTSCALMLIEYHLSKGYKSEVDLFIAQTVLQYLCLNNQRTATVAFYVYTRWHPNVDGPPFVLPLLNFIWFLLLAVETRANLAIFTVLCERYKSFLARDPMYNVYLDKIGQLFFGKAVAPSERHPAGGLLGNMISQLMTELDEEVGLGVYSEDVD
ncbi:Golgi to ER traffic protein 4 homolog [Galendromus occidentalis]|uniref:Golgi to ER traffic protein 4 homolog n=1 Tax=Galendromus occidentalis TaxID=34638 RepID=A0AAJ6QTF2_9ACAR|nr:Golgi to ER traffic protein 4 homolog [Galendromus occidentalis]